MTMPLMMMIQHVNSLQRQWEANEITCMGADCKGSVSRGQPLPDSELPVRLDKSVRTSTLARSKREKKQKQQEKEQEKGSSDGSRVEVQVTANNMANDKKTTHQSEAAVARALYADLSLGRTGDWPIDTCLSLRVGTASRALPSPHSSTLQYHIPCLLFAAAIFAAVALRACCRT